MTERIRFHLDENVDSAIADGLRRRGIDVTMPNDVGLIGATDDEHLAFAISQNRVILTQDDDFLSMAKGGISNCGIAYCHNQSRSIGQMLSALLLIWDCMTPGEMKDHIEFL